MMCACVYYIRINESEKGINDPDVDFEDDNPEEITLDALQTKYVSQSDV